MLFGKWRSRMYSRRAFLTAALAGSTGAALFGGGSLAQEAPFLRRLPVPRLLDARKEGNKLKLVAGHGRHSFLDNTYTATAGYSSEVLGPAIRAYQGDEIDVAVENRLDRRTTVHWHGLLIPSSVDGGPHNSFAPGKTFNARLKIDQAECTAWFHPHPHGDTARQVYSGLSGLLLIEDGTAERLGLPRTYGVDDIPIILQDRAFAKDGSLIYEDAPFTTMMGMRGDVVVANGVWAPVAKIPASLVRLRLLNGSNARNYNLSFDDRRTFHVVASDGGYLPQPVPMQTLVIAPGERFEMIVDFKKGGSAILETGADNFAPMMGMMRGVASDAARILKIETAPELAVLDSQLPDTLVPMRPPDPARSARRRSFVLNDHMMGMGMRGNMGMAINGRSFDMDRVDTSVLLGSSEIWQIDSQMLAHPFHIHGVQFRTLSLNGRKPPEHLQGFKDTVLVARTAEILVTFTQPATRQHPFMYHCHILEHEDAGMMGQYITT
jgi:blue copper oxidase